MASASTSAASAPAAAAPAAALITGGAGFVGRRLSRALLEQGVVARVVLFDVAAPPPPLPPPADAPSAAPSSSSSSAAAAAAAAAAGADAPLRPGETYVHGDVRSQAALEGALRAHAPVVVVFHLAAAGMSGVAQLDRASTWGVNVGGARAAVAACRAAGVPRLVHTSTVNVVFTGLEVIRAGEEKDLPYAPPEQQLDEYSRSKTRAERDVLAGNGAPLLQRAGVATAAASPWPAGAATAATAAAGAGAGAGAAAATAKEAPEAGAAGAAAGGDNDNHDDDEAAAAPFGRLRTCALRPNGIFGAGEQQHARRVLAMARLGLTRLYVGNAAAAAAAADVAPTDWTHVDNLVAAQLLAAAALGDASAPGVAAGQAYFITDGAPVDCAANGGAFFAPMLLGLGLRAPRWRLPHALAAISAWLAELVLPRAPAGWRAALPLLTRSELRKASVEHWFSVDKARRELGYRPVQGRTTAEYVPGLLLLQRRQQQQQQQQQQQGSGGGAGSSAAGSRAARAS